MTLRELAGKHIFSGAEYVSDGNANGLRFVLDGVCYTALEDAEDDYRSMMKDLIVDRHYTITNKIPDVEVFCTHSGDNDILTAWDVNNGKEIFLVGTDYSDDYYPSFVYSFSPENLSINEEI